MPNKMLKAILWMEAAVLFGVAGTTTVKARPEYAHSRVVGVQQGLWTVPSNQVFLRYNFSERESKPVPTLFNYTICYWIRGERSTSLFVHVSYAVSDLDANNILLYQGHDRLLAFINGVYQSSTHAREFPFVPGVWHHLCHVIEEEDYAFYWGGKEFLSGSLVGVPGAPLNGSLVIGQEQDRYGGKFDKYQALFGEIGQLNVWDRALAPAEIGHMAACRGSVRGNVFSLDTADMEVVGNVSDTRVELGHFCRETVHYVVLSEWLTFPTALALCRLIGGTMPAPSSSHGNDVLLKNAKPFMDSCTPESNWKYWLGIVKNKESDTWVNIESGEEAKYLNFAKPYPMRADMYQCVVLLDDGTWANHRCSLKKCAICHLPTPSLLYLRGFCFDIDYQRKFRVDKYFGGRLVFRGHEDLFIFWSEGDESWHLHDIDRNVTLARTEQVGHNSYPVGTHRWVAVEQICDMQKGSVFEMILSKCTDDLFVCSSGDCIERSLRCNLWNDCSDGSDEENCDVVAIGSSYQPHLPPRGPTDAALTLTPTVTLSRIAKIDEIAMSVTLEFFTTLAWRDERLSFRHLTPGKETPIPATQADRMWIPDFQLLDLEGGQPKVLDEKVMITTANNATLPMFNSIERDLTYPGTENDLTMTRQFSAKFTCLFNLHVYPFDKQECSINLRLSRAYQDRVSFSREGWRGTYTGPKELALYTVKGVAFRIMNDPRTELSLCFELHRRQGVILLSTFVPSVLLLLVSWAALFLEDLNVSANLSLTNLLVLYTLFSNLLRSVPDTAAVKMIDIWFFFAISLLFLNIMVIIFIDYAASFFLHAQAGESAKDTSLEKKRVRIMSLYRSVIPFAFLAFNVTYWWLVVFVYN
ncbi:LOW QUALITY PROTEIN: uncharacterized protein LOC119587939 [Penaeus monodon]|uniref:LOW QUALITY PROTEIN: uncharacterized protein LOC119587939 n=1 Tax=Penaeus monodon TaxID=6687 RepID=UPI0018A77781|nr:LOW QUALITY PROTEIN: uncharacterized protein LOC119587939 [Penaeus monodon]